MASKLLVIDEDEKNLRFLKEALTKAGFEVDLSTDGLKALDCIQSNYYDAVFSEVALPSMSGFELLRRVVAVHPALPVILMTGRGTVEGAVTAMKEGARDYLLKPLSLEVVSLITAKLMEEKAAQSSLAATLSTKRRGERREIITRDQEILRLVEIVKSIAPSQATVLIYGESGTGKELFARLIHEMSPRRNNPFVAVNCAAIPENLLESELFGHEKGAFTGAAVRKIGKFEMAEKGTILLDEISEMDLYLQAKLLRVLQEYEVDRVGGREPVPVDVRVLATTNQDLARLVEEKKFRQDLYYRLNVIPLHIPPLRKRKNDIPVLANYFLKRFSTTYQKKVSRISDRAMQALLSHPWRGNIREMENTLERATLLATGETIEPENLILFNTPIPAPGMGQPSPAFQAPIIDTPPPVEEEEEEATPPPPVGKSGRTIEEMERALIFQTLDEVSGNRTHAAKILGISIRTLRNKLAEYKEKEGLG
ncbi:MAG: sigma-54-dependent Fis family transcriptional regulator [Deltaproteobacteria bacterium]|nr:sigma-54-dependent Fis family transcriptional regulator [Deltaproteobacteria bacterium]